MEGGPCPTGWSSWPSNPSWKATLFALRPAAGVCTLIPSSMFSEAAKLIWLRVKVWLAMNFVMCPLFESAEFGPIVYNNVAPLS